MVTLDGIKSVKCVWRQQNSLSLCCSLLPLPLALCYIYFSCSPIFVSPFQNNNIQPVDSLQALLSHTFPITVFSVEPRIV